MAGVFADPYRPVELAGRIFYDTFRLLNVTPIERVFDGTLYDQRIRRSDRRLSCETEVPDE